MKYTDILSEYYNNPKNGKDLIFKFFITFARFECALKNSNEFAMMNGTKCQPNWDKFANSLKSFNSLNKPNLDNACSYILNNPPKKQYIYNNQLKWKDSKIDSGTDVQKLNQYIRRIRNNLFHGGKFKGDNIPEISRNAILMTSALLILNSWLEYNQDVKDLFLAEIFD